MPDDPLHRVRLALDLLHRDPGLGGVVLRARAGPARDVITNELACLPRLHPQIEDEALLGGIDLTGTLSSGRFVQRQGLLSRPGGIMLTMAERISPGLAGRLGAALDLDGGHWFVALDEGAEPDEVLPDALAERLAFHIDLTDTRVGDLPCSGVGTGIAPMDVVLPNEMAEAIAALTVQLGIGSARAAGFALRAARGLAALDGRRIVSNDDLQTAASLTLGHRATQLPAEDEADAPPPEPEGQDAGNGENDALDGIPQEMLLEAVAAMIPADLLDRIAARKARVGRGSGSGAARKGNRRGRPLPSRPGRPGGNARIDLVATLRAAAPWQRLRSGPDRGLKIRRSDLRVRRFEERSDRLLIFTVDASGSAALARLAEAKGAVEILLAEAYARRDHVSLIGFRGEGAEVLLPPTRSLVQTKRRLAALPGGGGTPLAAGLEAALRETVQARRHGLTPTVCLLTDGRANISLDGRPDRSRAADDALSMARVLQAEGADALVIDTGKRPERTLAELAKALGATYLPMPRADAERLSQAVSTALGD